MKDNSYAKMGYPVVSQTSPFLNITVRNVDLLKYTPFGAGLTYAKIYRAGENHTWVNISVVEVVNNTFKFIMTPQFLAQEGGRYEFDLYYKGNYIGMSQFQYNKQEPTFEGTLRV